MDIFQIYMVSADNQAALTDFRRLGKCKIGTISAGDIDQAMTRTIQVVSRNMEPRTPRLNYQVEHQGERIQLKRAILGTGWLVVHQLGADVKICPKTHIKL